MVAREIGEGAGARRTPSSRRWAIPCEEASSARCVTPSRGEIVERSVQADRIGRRQRAIDRAAGRDEAERAERGGRQAERRPDLPREGRDRGLAAGAGDRDDRLGLARIEPRAGPGRARRGRRRPRSGSARDRPLVRRRARRRPRRRPCRNACGAKSRPSARTPGTAKKAEPGVARRLSQTIALTSRSVSPAGIFAPGRSSASRINARLPPVCGILAIP